MTKIGLYALGKSTTLESNKSTAYNCTCRGVPSSVGADQRGVRIGRTSPTTSLEIRG